MVNSEYHRDRRRARRKKFIELLGGECVNCGSKKNLHFDHKDPSDKSFYISRYLNYADKNIIDELNKCQLLCSDCHEAKTRENWDYGSAPSAHGTLWRYKKYKCRCDKCKKALSDYYYSKLAIISDLFINKIGNI